MKTYFFLKISFIFLFINSIIGYSQSIWYKTFGSWNEGEQAHRIVQTFDRGYLVLSEQGNTSPTYYNIFKLDSVGNLLWRKLLADSSNKDVYEFKQTIDSGFIFTGRCTTSPWGGFLIKTDKNGNFKWQKNYTNLSYQTQFSMVRQTYDKGFITCGFYVDLINGGSKGVAVKTDSLGNLQWEKQYLDSLMNHYTDIIQDSIGNYYLTGNIYNMSDNLYTVIKKLNSSGNIIWTKIFGNKTGGEFLFEMKNKSIMSISVSAYNYNPGYVPIATKLDTAGNIKWFNNYPYSIMNLYACKDNFDNISFAGNVDTNNIMSIRIKKIDSSGVLFKNKLITFSGFNFISSQCINMTTDLGFIISGSAAKLDTFLNPHSFSLVIKTDSTYNAPVVINKINNNPVSFLKDFTLYQNYPNPFNSSTTIKFHLPNNGDININVYNVLGKKVFSKKKYYNTGFNEYKIDFNEHTLCSGVYFVKINYGDNSKLIKAIYLK